MVLDVISQNKVRILLVSGISVLAGAANILLLVLVNRDMHMTTLGLREIAEFVGEIVLMVAISFISQLALSRLGARMLFRLREELVNGISGLSSRKIEHIGRHRLYAALTRDVPSVHDFLVALPSYIFNLTVALSCLVYLATVSPKLFVVFVVFLVIGLGVAKFAIADHAETRLQARRKTENDLFKCYEAVIDGSKELKLNQHREERFVGGELQEHASSYRNATMSAEFFLNLSSNWAMAVIFIGIGGLIFLAPHILEAGERASVAVFVMTIFYLVGPLTILMNSFRTIHAAKVGVRQLNTLELHPTGARQNKVTTEPFRSMSIRGLTFRYSNVDGGTTGFRIGPLDIDISRAEIVYFVGGNGSGKSTVAKLITGLYEKDEGTILINGAEVSDRKTYFQYFSAIFQDYYLFKTLVPKHGRNADPHDVRRWVEKLGLTGKVSVDEGRLSTTKLSHGQRKRLALLIAYFDESDIYVLDEWTADQDQEFREFFYREFLPELKSQGKTVLVVSHDERYFHLADRIVKFDGGSIVSVVCNAPPIDQTVVS